MIATLAFVVATAALILAGLGAVPGWIGGEPRGVRRVASVDEAERSLGAILLVPAYFPDRLTWPAAAVRVAGGRRGSAALTFVDRAGTPVLELLQSTAGGAPVAGELLAGRTVLDERRTALEDRPATLATVLLEGTRWQELAFRVRDRSVILRGRGEPTDLFAIARSIHGRAP